MRAYEWTRLGPEPISTSYQGRAKQPPVKDKNHDVRRDRDDRPQDADLAESRAELIPAGGNRGEGDVRCRLGKAAPLVAETAAPLGIAEGGATEREQQQRAEKNQGRNVAVHHEVHERPQADAPEEWVARDADNAVD